MHRIRAIRRERGMTMKQLGSIVGVSEAAISHYETGRREPDPNMLGLLANALGVTVDYLMGRDDVPAPQPAKPLPTPESIPEYLSRLTPENRAFIEEMARKLLASQETK